MRPWILLLLVVACTKPLRPPQPQPDDPNGISGCRSAPTLGGVRYECTNYIVHDTNISLEAFPNVHLGIVSAAHKLGIETTSSDFEVKGAKSATLVKFQKGGSHAFDVLAMTFVGARVRMLQCHVEWFEGARSFVARENTCADTLALLLERPAPAAPEVSAECTRATKYLMTLPSSNGEGEEGRAVMRDFAVRCTDTLAACVLASKTYAEASLCKD